MPIFKYCSYCQSRLDYNRQPYYEISSQETAKMLNKIKPTIRDQLNKSNNEEIIKIGSFIHKKCKLRANSLIKNNSFKNGHSNNDYTNYNENIDPTALDNSYTHIDLVNDNSNQNTNSTAYDNSDQIEEVDTNNSFQSSDENEDSQAVSKSNESITDNVSTRLQKGRSSHKYSFICNEKNSLMRIKDDARFEVLAKSNIFIAEESFFTIRYKYIKVIN